MPWCEGLAERCKGVWESEACGWNRCCAKAMSSLLAAYEADLKKILSSLAVNVDKLQSSSGGCEGYCTAVWPDSAVSCVQVRAQRLRQCLG